METDLFESRVQRLETNTKSYTQAQGEAFLAPRLQTGQRPGAVFQKAGIEVMAGSQDQRETK